jgi:glutamate-1-semialdehyde 2,1-aminomutase
MKSAKGAYLTDADNRQYVDYINSWGPAIVGAYSSGGIRGNSKQAESGFSFRNAN